jgi:predicted Zn-dependent protease
MDVSPQTEQEMAQQSFQEVMQQYGGKVLGKNHPTSQYVREIVRRLVESNGLEADQQGTGSMNGWEVFVVKDDQTQNA